MVKIFRVKGWFKQGFQKQTFTREIPAISEKHALERIYSEVGSKHRIKRNLINIENITEIKPEEVTDPRVAAQLR